MHIVYPENPLRRNQVDEQFATEAEAVREAGFEIELFAFEKLQNGNFFTPITLRTGAPVFYRGWMLSPSEYETLVAGLVKAGAQPLVLLEEYLANHYLPNWYPKIKELTPETRIFEPDCNLEA